MTAIDNARKRVACTTVMWAAALLFAPLPVAGQTVAPGAWIYLDAPVRNGVECWIGFSASDCSLPRWRSPGLPTESTGNLIRGNFEPLIPIGVSLDNRAIAWVDYEFTVQGPGGFVDAAIAVKYDLTTALVGGAAYSADTSLTLTLTDISDPNGAAIASLALFEGNRQGDQGLTDVSAGKETHIFTDEVSNLNVTLARGRKYRARIAAQGSGSMLLLGAPAAMAEAVIHYLRVQTDEDEFTRLETHDAEMKQIVATHDADIKQAVATHDADMKQLLETHDTDIKALLKKLMDGQQEIIRLLLTPQGRRSSTFCATGDCSFPIKSNK